MSLLQYIITKRYIYVTGNDKVYDGTSIASLTISNLVAGSCTVTNDGSANAGTPSLTITVTNVSGAF